MLSQPLLRREILSPLTGERDTDSNDNLLNMNRERAWTMGEPVLPLVEPDLVGIWRKHVWWFGLRWPFSFVLFSWVTVASTLAPEFHLDRYLLTMLAGFRSEEHTSELQS